MLGGNGGRRRTSADEKNRPPCRFAHDGRRSDVLFGATPPERLPVLAVPKRCIAGRRENGRPNGNGSDACAELLPEELVVDHVLRGDRDPSLAYGRRRVPPIWHFLDGHSRLCEPG